MNVPQFKLIANEPQFVSQKQDGDDASGTNKLWMRGVATKREVDTDGDVVEPMGGKASWDQIMSATNGKGTPGFWNHNNWDDQLAVCQTPVAKFSEDMITHETWFNGRKTKAAEIYQDMQDGHTYGMSLRFFPLDWSSDKALDGQTGVHYKEWRWQAVEPVSFGANPAAIEQYTKMCKGIQAKYVVENIGRDKVTLGKSPPVEYQKQSNTLVSKALRLDANEALERGNMETLCKCFALGSPGSRASMVYEHHSFDANGAMVVNTRALITAMDQLMCDFTEGRIEEKAARTAYNHLAKHYRDAGIKDQLPAFGLYKPLDLAGKVIDQTISAYADEQAAAIERAHKIGIGVIKIDDQFKTLAAIANSLEPCMRAVSDWFDYMPPKNSKSQQVQNDINRIHTALGLLGSKVQVSGASGNSTDEVSLFLKGAAELKKLRNE